MDKEKLEQYPFFTGKMLKAFLNKNHPSVTLVRWKHKIKKIEKGKYTIQKNVLTYATTLVIPSYCSFRSALSYYQLTNQLPIKVQVVIKKRKKDLEEIEFIKSKYMFGYVKKRIDEFDFFIAEKEKLLIDCLLYKEAGVFIDELEYLLKEDLDINKIINYLKKINNLNLIKRVGYLLEQNNKFIYNYFSSEIRNNTNYPKLQELNKKSNKINKKWRLNIN